jgi:prepilin-type N-terminal cleavage/methylation domain-containing protein
MGNLRRKGFTLIELAIVLVIIGIIIGAILKGQELIQNARMKKFINNAGRKWEVAIWTYLDREGRLPGDSDKDGIIGDGDVKSDLTGNNLLSLTDNPVTLGSFSFYVGLGNNGATVPRNVLVICPVSDAECRSTSTADEVEFFKAFDAAIDETADPGVGIVRGYKDKPTFNSASWIMTVTSANIDTTPGNWTTTTHKALVYFFDRRP